MSYTNDREWADSFLPRIKELLGRHLIRTATDAEDQKEATDLRLALATFDRSSSRMFRYATWLLYPHDFTIRFSRPTMARTEFAKIITDGWAGLYFVGWAAEGDASIAHYAILDSGAFRRGIESGEIKPARNPRNPSEGTTFLVFDILRFPLGVVLWTSEGYRDLFASCACRTCRDAKRAAA